MKTIVIVSRKGGAGKTTLAVHLGVEADRIGDGPVAIIDADPMGGASGWYNARKTEGGPQFVGVGSKGLKATLVALEDAGGELVIIDPRPGAPGGTQSIIAESDLAIVPVIPSPNDLRAIGETLDLVEAAGRPVLFVLNNASA